MRRMETELSGPRSTEALKIIEDQVTRVSSQIADGEARSRASLAELEARLANAEAGEDPARLIDQVVSQLGQRLADAEARTGEALESLRDSLAQLDQRMYAADGSVRSDMDSRLTSLADQLSRRVEDARTEIAERLAATGGAQVEARLGEMAEQIAAADQRSARAIEHMGREVLTMAETLNRRVQSAEQRSAEAIEQVGGEIARIAGAVENRLGRTDQLHAEALERLGAEIGKITERLTDRIIQSERRAAQAIDDVGEQVANVTERLEQRHERIASDLAERIRQSEERTARLLENARDRLEAQASGDASSQQLATPTPPVERDDADAGFPAAAAVFGAELFLRAEPVSQPALDPGNPAFDEEDFAHVDVFAPTDEFAPLVEVEDEDRPALEAPSPANEAPELSTREVIEQARAVARATVSARPKTLHAGERRTRQTRAGIFGSLKPSRATSTWQTALMVAGGAAFLSVGAAGVVLMEGPGGPRHEAQAFAGAPRAALALEPEATPSSPGPNNAAPTPSQDPPARAMPASEAPDYAKAAAGVERNRPGALADLKVLAEGGSPQAQMYLARLYENGLSGVSTSLTEARRWTARAAEAGDPAAMHNLALFNFRGEGGAQDVPAAAQWFKKAAEAGVVDSQYNLGLLYQSGSGVPRDLSQAYKWFSIAANAGDGEARASAVELQARLGSAQLAAAESQVKAFEPAKAPAGAAGPLKTPAIAAAQKILGRLGYYKGRPDGTQTNDLKLAVSAYQRDQGLAATGSLDPATVSRLSVFSR